MHELQRCVEWCGRMEDAGMGHDAQEFGEGVVGHRVRLIGTHQRAQPRAVVGVTGRIGAKGAPLMG